MAFEIEGIRMGAHMFRQIVAYGKAFIAHRAKVIFLLCVHGQMYVELGARLEFAIADIAKVQIFVLMAFLMHVQCGIYFECFRT